MDDFQGSYAPQSPDLSGYNDFDEPEPAFSNPTPPVYSNSYYTPQPGAPHQAYDQHPSNHSPYSYNQASISTSQYPPQSMSSNGRVKQQTEDHDYVPEPKSATKPGPGRKKKPKVEEEICEKPAPGVEEGIEVKTKFPVARIKRIMQADEDVGKVAQVTPTAVSKALELFMISIVTKAAQKAREKSQKRVTSVHLKQALQEDEQFDFLADIIAKVPDAPASKKKEEAEDSEEAVENKKRKRAPTKRKKKDDDDDEDED